MKNFIKRLILIILIIILIYVLYSKYILKEKLTKVGGYGFLLVLTGSMEPEIKDGELVIIKQDNNYSEGDIITYETEEYLVTHRIVKDFGSTFIAQGDANNEKDDIVEKSKIVGKVIYHSEAWGYFVRYYLKIILVIFIVFLIVRNIYFAVKTESKEQEESGENKNLEEKFDK